MRFFQTFIVAVTCAVAAPVFAQPGNSGGKHGNQANQHANKHANARIGDQERVTIQAYFNSHPSAVADTSGLPPGLRKKVARGGSLPPGWQKKLAVGQPIPADIWQYRQPLPPEVIRSLPPQPEGVITVRVNDRIVRVAAATLTLIDAFGLNR